MVFQLCFILGDGYLFQSASTVHFFNDCIFRWRETWWSVVIRLRRYRACLMCPRINSFSASWVKSSSWWFEVYDWYLLDFLWIAKMFGYLFYIGVICSCWWMIEIGHSIDCIINKIICRGFLLRIEESVIFQNWTSRRALNKGDGDGWLRRWKQIDFSDKSIPLKINLSIAFNLVMFAWARVLDTIFSLILLMRVMMFCVAIYVINLVLYIRTMSSFCGREESWGWEISSWMSR